MLTDPSEIQIALIFLVAGYLMGRGVKGETIMDVLIAWLRPGQASGSR